MSRLSVAAREVLVAHCEQADRLDQRDHHRNEAPGERQIENPEPDAAAIEFVYACPAEEHREQRGHDAAAGR